ncbi:hypothetical protein ACFUC1_15200 [Pedococcus sp. NPDC057267]|uniref:hypothetical protein n=1 Tax=Pedococcus sp. NPDC057267 TaxID=3346077 RepID=UPI00362757FC
MTLTSSTFGYGPHREGRQVARLEVPGGSGLLALLAVDAGAAVAVLVAAGAGRAGSASLRRPRT